jgi:hypothetical protein
MSLFPQEALNDGVLGLVTLARIDVGRGAAAARAAT